MYRIMMAAAAAATLAAAPAAAQTQQGLVNVNITDLEIIKNSLNDNNVAIAVPVNVQVPIGVAANVCGISVLAIREQNNECTAQSASTALGQAVSRQVLNQKNRNN
ncbi:hypothetical protein [Sphingosinicella sp. CPCC 101087]|uniref:hypothetical protein n=1 Tax=Sphingosinicella sp. CPCC 101087 TaxID=2497754 RepID=UPI00101C1F5A|nr:hypothetical protein [Sphingosinicella sp. CPCC 101087]